jgi:hypothetical protein
VKRNFIKALFDLHCEWYDQAPSYRIYVNDELFAERTFVWKNEYLTEMLQITAPAGTYSVQIKPIEKNLGTFTVRNLRVEVGNGRWTNPTTLEILP